MQRGRHRGVNTPGANANAVKELVLGGLVLASRKVGKGMEWAKTLAGQGDAIGKLVERGKANLPGRSLRARPWASWAWEPIGVKVANMATHLGMEVLGYDPYISVEGAWSLSRSVRHCVNLSDLIAQCDYITLHIPATAETKGFVNDSLIAQMKHGVRILNFARGELVNTAAMVNALKTAAWPVMCAISPARRCFPRKARCASRTWAPPHRRARTIVP